MKYWNPHLQYMRLHKGDFGFTLMHFKHPKIKQRKVGQAFLHIPFDTDKL